MRLRAPFAEVIDLYSTRFKAIEYFSTSSNFFLFGTRWDEKKNLTKALADQIEKLAPKPVASKMDTLSKFKFCICFENCSHPGYLTEKIFDCFFAGTIPIYFGAPNIEKFIPKDCFIDFRDFNDFKSLDIYLADLTIENAEGFLRSTEAFISSSQFLKFTDTYLANQIFNSMTKEMKDS